MVMFTWWDARGRRLPWLIALVLVFSVVMTATASAGTIARLASNKGKAQFLADTGLKPLLWRTNCGRRLPSPTWKCRTRVSHGKAVHVYRINVRNGKATVVGAIARASRTPRTAEWKHAAELAAARECNARERRSPRVGEWPVSIPIHVCNQFSAKGDKDPCGRNLANDVAHCWASFTMDYWTKGLTRSFHGYVPMYLARPRPRDKGPRIGVRTPIDWFSWWSASPPT